MLMYCFKQKDQIKNQLSGKKISNKHSKVTTLTMKQALIIAESSLMP